jgi:hypothetical protein
MKSLLMAGVFIASLWPQASRAEEQIRVQAVNPTPESVTTQVTVAYPREGQVVKNPVWMQVRVDGYALGAGSQFDRASELVETDMGQTLHIIVDNNPYFPINGPAIDPFDEEGYFYDTSYKFKLPRSLTSGEHVLRVFPARSYGESLKGEKTFFVTTFYVGDADSKAEADLSKPYLTYNEPSNNFYLVQSKPVLLDFLLTNCELTPDGYKVRLTIDGKMVRVLTAWQPYYIYGLKRGNHTVRLELIDRKDARVPGPFNDVTQTITIH